MPAIPLHPNELSPSWFTSVLANAGFEHSVRAVELSPVGTGQMADSLRARLSYAGGLQHTADSDNGPTPPASLVIKMTSADETSRSAGARGAYQREVEWYRQLNATTTIATPHHYFAEIDDETSDFVLVLEDMHPAQQGDQVRGCSIAEARRALDNLIGLHAPTWCRDDLHGLPWLHATEGIAERLTMTEHLFAHSAAGFLDRYDAYLNPEKITLIRWFAGYFPQWIRRETPVFAATHGDYRLDNLLFAAEPADEVWAVDWQTVRIDNPLADVAYLLGTSLNNADRSATERDLVHRYHQGLLANNVDNYSFGDCFDDYRTQSLYSLVIIVLGSMLAKQTTRGDEMFMTMLDRSSHQIAHLDARDTLT